MEIVCSSKLRPKYYNFIINCSKFFVWIQFQLTQQNMYLCNLWIFARMAWLLSIWSHYTLLKISSNYLLLEACDVKRYFGRNFKTSLIETNQLLPGVFAIILLFFNLVIARITLKSYLLLNIDPVSNLKNLLKKKIAEKSCWR